MLFWATLASMRFFRISGAYNLYCFGTAGYKNDVKTAKKKKTNKKKKTQTYGKHLIV